MRHEPLAFEFNERFLLELNEHTHSCLYGTFVGNCDKDRKDLDVPARTRSFWRHVDRHIVAYTNPYYTVCRHQANWCNRLILFSGQHQPRQARDATHSFRRVEQHGEQMTLEVNLFC